MRTVETSTPTGIRIGADLLYFNPYLREARIASGYNTNAAACRAIKMQQSLYGLFERLRGYPRHPSLVKKIECVFHRPFDYLFPPEIRQAIDLGAGKWKRLEIIKEVPITALTHSDFTALSYDEPEIEDIPLADRLEQAMDGFSDRQREIIQDRFGLNGRTPQTLGTISKRYGVQKERIRQIEANALRRLRHPLRTKILKDYLPGSR